MFNVEIAQVLETLNTSKKGLSKKEGAIRLEKNGKNALAQPPKKSMFLRFLAQFKDALIVILLIAATVSASVAIIEGNYSEILDAVLILIVVIINAFIGLFQENKADKAMEALKNMTKPYAKVVRNNKTVKIKTEDIVVGDIVVLEAGDIVPADLRLFENASLKIEESALTGESVPSEKNVGVINKSNLPLGDQHNMAFMGSVVVYGRGKGVVVACGMDTQMGKIADVINIPNTEPTPLTKRITKTGKTISLVVVIVSLFIFISGVIRGQDFMHSFMIAVAIAVSSIPEGLPTALTVTMSLGVEQMSKRKAIVKKLPAVETLGSTEIICSDKTGTLTLNKMTVKQIYVSNLPAFKDVLKDKYVVKPQDYDKDLRNNKNISTLIKTMLLCNDTQLKYENEQLLTIGDPTETALVHYGYSCGFFKDKFDGAHERIDEVPFDSQRKLMTTIHEANGELTSYTKGAVDSILPRVKFILDGGVVREITDKDIEKITATNKAFGSQALRVLGYAFKPLGSATEVETIDHKEVEKNLVFVGLTGMIDPPREEAYDSIKLCKKAGIKTVMITGDHKDTAYAIAKELGICQRPNQVITGVELDNISDDELVTLVNKYNVFARVNPEHKVKIVNAFKAQDKIVAMTGDGVNDAPSLRSANIGVGMGISGTDVTKGVADIILTDDNFATIVGAVKEGRRVYSNIMKIVKFMLTTSISEVLLMFIVIALLGREFFTPALILYINFVTDTLVALALGAEKADRDIMDKKPNRDQKSILASKTGLESLFNGILQTLLIFAVYFLALEYYNFSNLVTITMSFITLASIQLFHGYNSRNDTQSIFYDKVFSNKFLNYAFLICFTLTTIVVLLPLESLHLALGITDLNVMQWLIAIGFGFAVIPVFEIKKLVKRSIIKSRKKVKK